VKPPTKNRPATDRLTLTVFISALIYGFIIWWPSRYFPAFGDVSAIITQPAIDLFHGDFQRITTSTLNLFTASILTGLLALGAELLASFKNAARLIMLPFLPLLIVGSFLWFKETLNRHFAIFGAVLMGVTPLILAEYLNTSAHLPALALAVWALWLAQTRRFLPALILFTFALLTHLSVLVFTPYLILLLPKTKRLYALLPLLILALWLGLLATLTGYTLVLPDFNLSQVFSKATFLFQTAFIDQGRLFWLIPPVLLLTTLLKKRTLPATRLSPLQLALLAPLSLLLLLPLLFNQVYPRDILFLLPGLILLSLTALQHSTLRKNWHTSLLLIMVATALINWKPAPGQEAAYDFTGPRDLRLLDSVQVFRELGVYLQSYPPDTIFYGGEPEITQLAVPVHGYVEKPLNLQACDQFRYQPNLTQILIVHPYSPSQVPCADLLRRQEPEPVYRFEKNGQWLEIYQL
jgi:hypothetical protein